MYTLLRMQEEVLHILTGETYQIKAEISRTSSQTQYTSFMIHYGVNGRKNIKVATPSGDVQFIFSRSAFSVNHTEPGAGRIPHILSII
ncbi:hypothetical protein AAVH_19357 [Aphelenchoides avenae]|nr:hypothetical protein AAVH_19357 [Aphelenchus avenae]